MDEFQTKKKTNSKFMTEVSSIMAKICNINFWIENDPPHPPPFGTFPKIHPFWKGNASLTCGWVKFSDDRRKGTSSTFYSYPGSHTLQLFSKIFSVTNTVTVLLCSSVGFCLEIWANEFEMASTSCGMSHATSKTKGGGIYSPRPYVNCFTIFQHFPPLNPVWVRNEEYCKS